MSLSDLTRLLMEFRLQDLVDIALLAVVIYWILTLIKGTRTIPILLGLTIMLGAYLLSTYLRLDAVSFVMDNLFSSIVIILVVLFQADIRNALARLGMTTLFRETNTAAQRTMIDEIVQAAFRMAGRRIGGTIVMERETGLRNYIERGKELNAAPSVDLLLSIFHTTSPLHDGAVIITKAGSLAAARCILPLSTSLTGSASLGTRHRSGIGLSEETDAAVVIISEERGEVSLAHQGKLNRRLDETELRVQLMQLLMEPAKQDEAKDSGAAAQSAEA